MKTSYRPSRQLSIARSVAFPTLVAIALIIGFTLVGCASPLTELPSPTSPDSVPGTPPEELALTSVGASATTAVPGDEVVVSAAIFGSDPDVHEVRFHVGRAADPGSVFGSNVSVTHFDADTGRWTAVWTVREFERAGDWWFRIAIRMKDQPYSRVYSYVGEQSTYRDLLDDSADSGIPVLWVNVTNDAEDTWAPELASLDLDAFCEPGGEIRISALVSDAGSSGVSVSVITLVDPSGKYVRVWLSPVSTEDGVTTVSGVVPVPSTSASVGQWIVRRVLVSDNAHNTSEYTAPEPFEAGQTFLDPVGQPTSIVVPVCEVAVPPAPGFTVSPIDGLVTSEDGDTASFTVVLHSGPGSSVMIPVVSLNTDEGTVGPTNLVFSSENWDVPQSVTITGVDDDVRDGDVTYVVRVGPTTSSDPDYNGLGSVDLLVLNTDNDPLPVDIPAPEAPPVDGVYVLIDIYTIDAITPEVPVMVRLIDTSGGTLILEQPLTSVASDLPDVSRHQAWIAYLQDNTADYEIRIVREDGVGALRQGRIEWYGYRHLEANLRTLWPVDEARKLYAFRDIVRHWQDSDPGRTVTLTATIVDDLGNHLDPIQSGAHFNHRVTPSRTWGNTNADYVVASGTSVATNVRTITAESLLPFDDSLSMGVRKPFYSSGHSDQVPYSLVAGSDTIDVGTITLMANRRLHFEWSYDSAGLFSLHPANTAVVNSADRYSIRDDARADAYYDSLSDARLDPVLNRYHFDNEVDGKQYDLDVFVDRGLVMKMVGYGFRDDAIADLGSIPPEYPLDVSGLPYVWGIVDPIVGNHYAMKTTDGGYVLLKLTQIEVMTQSEMDSY